VRRIELQLGVAPSHYEPGGGAAAQAATTGADSGAATGKTDDSSSDGKTGERDVVRL
jgi:hypothetical protein